MSQRPDQHRIAQLEYELGFTDTPPAAHFTDAPGQVIYYTGPNPPAYIEPGSSIRNERTGETFPVHVVPGEIWEIKR